MKTTVISLGGSLIVPNGIDLTFLYEFKKAILSRKNERFVIVCGGGAIFRDYQDAAREIGVKNAKDLDWIGVASTWLNAELVRAIFGQYAYDKVIHEPTERISTNKRIIICSGWKPGFSTDTDAVLMAKKFRAREIINMTNVDYVYDKDPGKHRDAKPIKGISWANYLKITGKKFLPGMHLPFDPVASNMAKGGRIKVVVMNGKKLRNLRNFLVGKSFIGTTLS
jgi:uridylate kinase